MSTEHHRYLAHEFPKLKHRIHELKQSSNTFRALYEEYESVDNEIVRIEQEIENPSDEYTKSLKQRRVQLKDQLYGILTGHIHPEVETVEYVVRNKFRLPVDHGEVSRDWAERGYSCDVFIDPPGQSWRNFVHDTNELVTVMEGRLDVTLHELRYQLEPGDELFIPRGAVHSVFNVYQGETRWLYGYD